MVTLRELQNRCVPAISPEDFFVLLSHATGKNKVFLLAHPEYIPSFKGKTQMEDFFERRRRHEPVAYITSHKEFYGRDFQVTRDTLIPRPETELMIESIITFLREKNQAPGLDIIDLGTGSGNIIITLVHELAHQETQETNFFGIDVSTAALAIAKKNADLHQVAQQISFLESDLLGSYVLPHEKNRHCLIAANLPYLSTALYNASHSDVRHHEPKSALVSGTEGLNHYLRLLGELKELSPHYLSTTFFLEISPEQSAVLKSKILQTFPHPSAFILQDLSGRDRLIQASW